MLAHEVMFSRISDDYRTPRDFYVRQRDRFGFGIDLAASGANRLCREYFGPDHPRKKFRDARSVDWVAAADELGMPRRGFLNMPYSQTRAFVEKAAEEQRRGFLTAMLVAARTETKWWHEHVWDSERCRPKAGVQLEFVRGRLSFGLDVTDDMREAVIAGARGLQILPKTSAERALAKEVGLPVLIVRAILAGEPEVVAGAPFPSVLVVLWPDKG